jgi:predicted DNA binding CopG/RHH family protein
MAKIDPNREDKELLESYERGEWQRVNNLQREIKRYREYAAAWLEKNMLVYLTLPATDFEMLKQKAKQAGVPYQTLLTNVVHQFVTSER